MSSHLGNVLPVAGGLYDQHPALLDQWWIIIAEKAKHEHEENEKQRREQDRKSRSKK